MAVVYGNASALQVKLKGPYGSVAIHGKQILLTQGDWRGAVSPFSQEIQLPGVTLTSNVDLQPEPGVLERLRLWGTALAAENEDGRITVYAFGGRPKEDLTMQATITEVQQ